MVSFVLAGSMTPAEIEKTSPTIVVWVSPSGGVMMVGATFVTEMLMYAVS